MVRRIFRFLLKTAAWFIGLTVLLVLFFKWFPVPVTPLMVIRTVQQATRGKEIGEQVDRAEVVAAFADAGATLRSKLQTLAWVLPPQLVGRYEATIRAAVADQVQRMLSDLADRFERAAG